MITFVYCPVLGLKYWVMKSPLPTEPSKSKKQGNGKY